MANLGTGLDASVGFGVESSWNTPATITRFLPFDSDTVSRKKTTVQGMGLRAGILSPFAANRRIATREATGNITMDVQNQGMGLLFNHMLGSNSISNSGSVYTQVFTLGSRRGLSLTAQIGRPSADGTVNPFTYTGGKIVDYELSLATNQLFKLNLGMDFADEITLANTPTISGITQTGTAGSTTYYYRVSANLASGETSAGAEFKTALSNATLSSTNYNVVTWAAVTGATTYNVYRSTTAGAELKIASNVAATTYSDQSNTAGSGSPLGPLLTTPTYTAVASAAPFAFTGANTLTLGGSAVAAVKKFSVKPTNPSKTDRFYLGSSGVKAEQVDNAYRTVTGTLECEFTSLSALYAAYAADTGLAFQFKVIGDYIASTSTPYSVQIDMPKIFLDGDTPNVTGPDILTQTVPFVALYDGTNSALTITNVTSDTAL